MISGFNIGGQSIKFKTDASMVDYNGQKLSDVLDGAVNFTMSPFGKQLFEADEREFRKLLGITAETFWDEGQNFWQGEATLSDEESKFGTKSLYAANSVLQTNAPVTFGGDPFTISFWMMKGSLPLNKKYNVFRALGQTSSFGAQVATASSASAVNMNVLRGTSSLTTSNLTITASYTSTNWTHFEFDYNGAGKLYCFLNGAASKQSGSDGNPISLTVAREPRRLILGTIPGYVDEFRLIDGVCEHTSNFSSSLPTAPYSLSDYPNQTKVLMHFE